MISNRQLTTALTGILSADYFKLDEEIPGVNNVEELIRYADHRILFQHGSGNNRANLLYDERITISGNTSQVFNLDGGLTNKWGDVLNYDSVKLILIHNREEITSGNYLYYEFKEEYGFVGPQGTRILIEPKGVGLNVGAISPSSSSSEEGQLILNTFGSAVTLDLVIIGSDQEDTSSSGI